MQTFCIVLIDSYIILKFIFLSFPPPAKLCKQVYYYIVDSPRNEGKEFFEINLQSGEIFTKIVFDREKQGAYALEVEARDGAPSARPNSNGQPNSGKITLNYFEKARDYKSSFKNLNFTEKKKNKNKNCKFEICANSELRQRNLSHFY